MLDFYNKLNYRSIGSNVKNLIDRPDGIYCFRERKDRVYYVSERILSLANTVGSDHLLSFGTCFGKFTKSGKFRLHITALHYLAPYAQVSMLLNASTVVYKQARLQTQVQHFCVAQNLGETLGGATIPLWASYNEIGSRSDNGRYFSVSKCCRVFYERFAAGM